MKAKYALVGKLFDHTFCQIKLPDPLGQVFILTSVLTRGYFAVVSFSILHD